MTALSVEEPFRIPNPLDIIEEYVSANEWPFERPADDEMLVEVGGRWGNYQLYFYWREDFNALQFTCQMDLRVPGHRTSAVNDLLVEINRRMWLGHFDLCPEHAIPLFRHTIPLRGLPGVSPEQVEDVVDVALNECERYYPAFQFVIWGGKSAAEAVSAAILDTVGEA